MTPRPNLTGDWRADSYPDEHGYDHHYAGPVEVRFHDGYEPDGELVTRTPVRVQIERMSPGLWSVILSADGHDIHVNFHSKKRINVLWRDEP